MRLRVCAWECAHIQVCMHGNMRVCACKMRVCDKACMHEFGAYVYDTRWSSRAWICVCVCTSVLFLCLRMCVHIFAWVQVCAGMWVCLDACMSIFDYVCIRRCMCVNIGKNCVYVSAWLNVRARMSVCSCLCMHMHISTWAHVCVCVSVCNSEKN